LQDSVKHLLLVGGGHSHLAVLKSFGDTPAEGTRLTLLSPNRHAVYSGMTPGLIAGHYRPEECRIDLGPLVARAGGRFIEGSAVGVDLARREVITTGGGRLIYDLLSLDIGSTSGEPARASRQALRVRPVEGFLADWERLREAASRSEVRRIAVVGGGAGGVEVLLAMQHALAGARVEFTLLSDTRVLAGHNESVRRKIGRILGVRGITVRAGQRVLAVREGGLELEGGEGFDAQATVWATGAGAPSWIAQSGLTTDPRGFVAVSDALQSPSHAEVFAAGDCATIIGDSRPKSGVIAVRQGPTLAGNLRLALAGATPEPFRAPARVLALISCGERYAIASWGPLALEGAWIWRWKDRIDRRFVGRYRIAAPGA
jgi:selenide,water dikinase